VTGLLALALIGATIFIVYWLAVRRYQAAAGSRPPAEPPKPYATFEGGHTYATADEKLRIETDGPSACGEGMLLAIVDALRAKGAQTNPIEPESYGYMTVVGVGGEDVVLRVGSWGREFEWTLYVESPSGKVAPEIDAALRSLVDVRNVKWINARP
jgi:hypothetical protein